MKLNKETLKKLNHLNDDVISELCMADFLSYSDIKPTFEKMAQIVKDWFKAQDFKKDIEKDVLPLYLKELENIENQQPNDNYWCNLDSKERKTEFEYFFSLVLPNIEDELEKKYPLNDHEKLLKKIEQGKEFLLHKINVDEETESIFSENNKFCSFGWQYQLSNAIFNVAKYEICNQFSCEFFGKNWSEMEDVFLNSVESFEDKIFKNIDKNIKEVVKEVTEQTISEIQDLLIQGIETKDIKIIE